MPLRLVAALPRALRGSAGLASQFPRPSLRRFHVRAPLHVPASSRDAGADPVRNDDWLAGIGRGELKIHAGALASLGIRSKQDFLLVNESDLVKAGIPLVAARRLLVVFQPMPEEVSMMMGPKRTLSAAAEAGITRGRRPEGVIFASSAIGGALLGFGGCMFVMVAGGTPQLAALVPGLHKLVSAIVFPVGLSMVVFTGTDLLTSNMMYHSLPFLTHPHRNINASTMLKVWGLSFAGNMAGSITIASAAAAFIFYKAPWCDWATNLAVYKTSMPFMEVCVKAIGANWLVNVAIYMQLSSRSAGGKIAALWMPITTFVTLGLEHSVANMFLIPLGIFLGANVGWSDFLVSNLVPCCLGNLIGATCFMSLAPWYTDWYPTLKSPMLAEHEREIDKP